MLKRHTQFVTLVVAMASLTGCQLFVDDADREVYRLIEQRQTEGLGQSRSAPIDQEHVPTTAPASAYETSPHPTDSAVPEAFEEQTTEPKLPTTQAVTQPATQPAQTRVLTLSEALAYGFDNAREFQTAKEDLYLAALALSLERHLWTPQLMSEISAQYDNLGEDANFDRTATAIAEVSVEQRLPYGGTVAAKVISSLMRDLADHVTTAEVGAVILEADIPLLRGAGRVARESRYQAERNLIYAVRTFERFRRVFAVAIASDFFNLQRLRQEALNATESTKIFTEEVARARAFGEKERLIPLEVQRAEQNLLVAINRKIDAEERYSTALDLFKIRLSMDTTEPIDVDLPTEIIFADNMEQSAVESETSTEDDESKALKEAIIMPDVPESEAIKAALLYRLDLLNDQDAIDDASRGVNVAENSLLPDLRAFGSVRFDTDSDKLDTLSYRTKRSEWNAGVALEIPLDRKVERNALRRSLITKRRAERNYDEAKDLIRLQVRRAIRRVTQERTSLEIQVRNRDLAIERRRQARFQFDRGDVSNREVIEAEDALLEARNRLAQAQSELRLSILGFRRDTGTLRIDDRGRWVDPTNWSARSTQADTIKTNDPKK